MQFAVLGIRTLVTTKMDTGAGRLDGGIKVLAIDTNSRHDDLGTAYSKVFEIVKSAFARGVRAIYKKTDSALRGNIGAELAAAYGGAEVEQLPFIPAYPLNNRITVDGCQYIDGVPVHKAGIGRDIFSPVNSALIADIIHSQSDIPVMQKSVGEKPVKERGICVYNAASEEELEQIGVELAERGELKATAGCAGFARYLPEALGLKAGGVKVDASAGNGKILIVCGSINATSIAQMSYLKQKKYPAITLADYIGNGPGFARRAADAAVAMFADSDTVIVESLGKSGVPDGQAAVASGGRLSIVSSFALITRHVLEEAGVNTLFVIGGDTLRGISDEMDFDGIIPLDELAAGVVFGKVNGSALNIVTKSGGFGDSGLVYNVVENLRADGKKGV